MGLSLHETLTYEMIFKIYLLNYKKRVFKQKNLYNENNLTSYNETKI